MGGPAIYDYNTMAMLGIDPRTGQPTRMLGESNLKQEIRKNLRIMDEQEAVNRFKWYNLPDGIDGQLLERILYYRGQAILFYDDTLEKFFFLPYALSGTIDPYGRFLQVKALPFLGGTTTDDKNGKLKVWTDTIIRKPVYSLDEVFANPKKYNVKDICIILKDYTPQEGENIIPRKDLQEKIIDLMAEAFPMARTNLIANCGVQGMRVPDEDSKKQVEIMAQQIKRSATSGEPFVAVFGPQEFQQLTGGGTSKVQDFLMYMQSLDNFRRSCYGLKSGGVFEKKAHELQAEAMVNQSNTDLIFNDSFKRRLDFCDLVNLCFGLQVWCEASETATGIDANMDGSTVDNEKVDEMQMYSEGGEDNETT